VCAGLRVPMGGQVFGWGVQPTSARATQPVLRGWCSIALATGPARRRYQGVDFRNHSSWFCNDRASPIMWENQYDGVTGEAQWRRGEGEKGLGFVGGRRGGGKCCRAVPLFCPAARAASAPHPTPPLLSPSLAPLADIRAGITPVGARANHTANPHFYPIPACALGNPLELVFVKFKEHLRPMAWSQLAAKYDAWMTSPATAAGRAISSAHVPCNPMHNDCKCCPAFTACCCCCKGPIWS
jgi:hypothetical protein